MYRAENRPEPLLKLRLGKSLEKELRFPKQLNVIGANLLRCESDIGYFPIPLCFMLSRHVMFENE